MTKLCTIQQTYNADSVRRR